MLGRGKLDTAKIKVRNVGKDKIEFSGSTKNKDQYEKAAGKIRLETWKEIQGCSILDKWDIEKSKDKYVLTLVVEREISVGKVVEFFKEMVS